MSLSKNEIVARASKSLEKLENLVKANQLDEIKEIVWKAKSIRDWQWYRSDEDYVECAVRDAILLGQIETVRFFLEEDLSPNTHCYEPGSTSRAVYPLISFAVESGNLTLVKLLVEHGATVSPRDDYFNKGDDSAIRAAVKSGHADIVDYLLEKGAKAHGLCGGGSLGEMYGGTTFLAKAAQDGNINIIESLLKHGASIKSSLALAHEKFKHYYSRYVSAIKRDFSEDNRKRIIQDSLGYYSQFDHNYQLKSDVKKFIDKLNNILQHFDQANEVANNNTIELLSSFFKTYSIKLSKDQIISKLSQLMKNLQEFDQKKQLLEKERDQIKNLYELMVKTLLDYSFGTDFSVEKDGSLLIGGGQYGGLTFLKEIDISGFNLMGISIEGCPVTRAMLLERKLKGADKALISISDFVNLQDPLRRDALTARLEKAIQEKGSLINSEGVVNLIPLWRAAEMGDIETVKTRLKAGADPNNGESKSHTPIILAASKGHLDIVRMLAEHPNVNKKIIVKAIEEARNNKHEEVAAYLFEQQDVNAIDESGETLLHKAVEKKDFEQVKTLIGKGANVNLKNKNGQTPLLMASTLSGKKGSMIVEILLANKADANEYNWRSPLACAVKEGNSQSAAFLLPHTEKRELIRTSGWDGKETGRDPWYVDLMFDALRQKNGIEILSLLKANGADFNAKSEYGETLLNNAIKALPSFTSIQSSMRSIAFSISGCEDRLPKDILQQTANRLIEDSKKYLEKNLVLIDFLLANDANPALGNKEGYTPLHILIKDLDLQHLQEGYISILDRLFQRRVNVNAKSVENITPLHEAADTGDLLALEYLIKNGASINAKTTSGRTPLHCAAARCFPQTAEFLIRQGADVDIADHDNLTPLQLSKVVQQSQLQRYTFNSWQAKNDFKDKFSQIQKVLTKNYYSKFDLAQVKGTVDFYVDKLAEYPVRGPKLVRRVVVPLIKSEKEISDIIDDVFEGIYLAKDDKVELCEDLQELNKVAQMAKEKFRLRDNIINYNESDIANMVCIVTLQAMSDKQEQMGLGNLEENSKKQEVLLDKAEEGLAMEVESNSEKQASIGLNKLGFFKEVLDSEPAEEKMDLSTENTL